MHVCLQYDPFTYLRAPPLLLAVCRMPFDRHDKVLAASHARYIAI